MKKISLWIETGIFVAFIGLFFLMNTVKPDASFSEQENRYLQQKPDFTFSSLFSGKFTSNFETYVTDQFAFRDSWTTLKARCELALGKHENKGSYLCKGKFGDTIIEGFDAPERSVLESNIASVNALAENCDMPVYFGLIPDKSAIWQKILPPNAPNDSEREVIDYIYAGVNAQTINFYSALQAHADEYIYYRTDHHWTTLGAYYGYTALMESMGLSAHALDAYVPERVSDTFYGTTWSSSGFSWVAPDSMDIYVQEPDGLSILNYADGTPQEGVLYDRSYLDKKDKYSMFYGGNTPLLEIKTGIDDAPSLLIIRDSYTDSLSPYLLDHFSQIHILDLRYYRASLSAYIQEHDIDTVLVLYSVSNFCTDTNLFLLSR